MKLDNPLEAPGIIVLDTEPSDPRGKYQYKAILQRKHSDSEKPWERGFDGAWMLKIVGIYDDGPDITPGQWYLDTLLGYDDYGSGEKSDFIYIDAGQHWGVGNMLAVLKEAEEIAYGKIDESLNERAIKELLLKGPGYEPFLGWISKNTPLTIPTLKKYARENEMTLSELQDLATLYMEDASEEEIEILDHLVMTVVEGKMEGEIDEAFVDKYAHIPMQLRNWYQRPEVQTGYEEEKKVGSPKKRKPTKKAIEQMENLEDEIQDLRNYLRTIQSDNRDKRNESEEYSAEIIQNYGFDILDLLNSGISEEDKILALKQWNMKQDEKSKEISNPERMVQEHDYYYDEEKDQEEEELQQQINQKEEELSKFGSMYESLNEGISHRINFKRFEEEILKPLAEDLGVDFKVGRVSRVQSIGKKIIERYYAIGSLTILVRDIKRLGMPGEDIEPWIVDPKKPTKGLRFGSDWGSYKEFKNKVKELLAKE
jgi:ribosomal protein S15P/S13E